MIEFKKSNAGLKGRTIALPHSPQLLPAQLQGRVPQEVRGLLLGPLKSALPFLCKEFLPGSSSHEVLKQVRCIARRA